MITADINVYMIHINRSIHFIPSCDRHVWDVTNASVLHIVDKYNIYMYTLYTYIHR